jgi:hypothetical protein
MKFETKNVDATLLGLPENVDAYSEENCLVLWSAEIDSRQFGIKSIDIAIIGVDCNVDWSMEDEEAEPVDTEFFIGKNGFFNIDSGKFKIDHDMTVNDDGSCQPVEVEINFEKKTILVR